MVYITTRNWWNIYAYFGSVKSSNDDEPHVGQVVRYYRYLRKLTLPELATVISYPEQDVRQAEESSQRTDDTFLYIALARHLQIPPPLMGLSTKIFEPKESEQPSLMTQEELQELENPQIPFEERGKRFLQEIEAFKQLVITKSIPLSWETLEVYEMGLQSCKAHFFRSQKSYSSSPNRKKRPQTLSEKIQLQWALRTIDTWRENIEKKIEFAKWQRRDQLLFALYHFCALPGELTNTFMSENIYIPILPLHILPYQTKAIEYASELGNAECLATSLFIRARLYLRCRQQELAFRDFEQMLIYFQILRDSFGADGSVLIELTFALERLIKKMNDRGRQKFQSLLEEAYLIAEIREDLRWQE